MKSLKSSKNTPKISLFHAVLSLIVIAATISYTVWKKDVEFQRTVKTGISVKTIEENKSPGHEAEYYTKLARKILDENVPDERR